MQTLHRSRVNGDRNILQKNYPKTQNKKYNRINKQTRASRAQDKTEQDRSILTSPCRSNHLTDWCFRILFKKKSAAACMMHAAVEERQSYEKQDSHAAEKIQRAHTVFVLGHLCYSHQYRDLLYLL